MPVAVVSEWKNSSTDTTNYDKVGERLRSDLEGPPEGLIFHAAGFDGSTFRVFEVWETQDQHEAYLRDILMPILSSIGADGEDAPQTSTYELHNVLKP